MKSIMRRPFDHRLVGLWKEVIPYGKRDEGDTEAKPPLKMMFPVSEIESSNW